MSTSGSGSYIQSSDIRFEMITNEGFQEILSKTSLDKWGPDEIRLFLRFMNVDLNNVGEGFIKRITPDLFSDENDAAIVQFLMRSYAEKNKENSVSLNEIQNTRLLFFLKLLNFHYHNIPLNEDGKLYLDFSLSIINIKLHELYFAEGVKAINSLDGRTPERYYYMRDVFSYDDLEKRIIFPFRITPDKICHTPNRETGLYRVVVSYVITDTGKRTIGNKMVGFLYSILASDGFANTAGFFSGVPLLGPYLVNPLLELRDSLSYGVFHLGIVLGKTYLELTDISLVWPKSIEQSGLNQYCKAVFKRYVLELTREQLQTLSRGVHRFCMDWDQKIYARVDGKNKGSCQKFFFEFKELVDEFVRGEKIRLTKQQIERGEYVDRLIQQLRYCRDFSASTISMSDAFQRVLKNTKHEKHLHCKQVLRASTHEEFDKSYREVIEVCEERDKLLLRGFDRSFWMKEVRIKSKFLTTLERMYDMKIREGGDVREVRKAVKGEANKLKNKYLEQGIDVTYNSARNCPFGCPLEENSSSTLPWNGEKLIRWNHKIVDLLEKGSYDF